MLAARVHEDLRLLVVGLSNGIFALYELPVEMTERDKDYERALFDRPRTTAPYSELVLLQSLSMSSDPITTITVNETGEFETRFHSGTGRSQPALMACFRSQRRMAWSGCIKFGSAYCMGMEIRNARSEAARTSCGRYQLGIFARWEGDRDRWRRWPSEDLGGTVRVLYSDFLGTRCCSDRRSFLQDRYCAS